MKRGIIAAATAATMALLLATAAHADAPDGALRATPVGRLPFPERGYVIELRRDAVIDAADVRISENGERVRDVTVAPLAASGLRVGVVLAIDASESMTGRPLAAAVAAARGFVARRGSNEQIGLVSFNDDVRVLQVPTVEARVLENALSAPPAVAYGTRIYDALDRALALLARARIAAGSVVVLSDGADIGSRAAAADVISGARRLHVRVFTVGLRSGAFRPAPLRSLADATGGAYAEAASSSDLLRIYAALGDRLASEYLVKYRSNVRPESNVHVRIKVPAVGSADDAYVAPTPSRLAPFHRSLVARFLLSPLSSLVLSLVVAAFVALAVAAVASRRAIGVVERVNTFAPGRRPEQPPRSQTKRKLRETVAGGRSAQTFLGKLERDLEIADIQVPATVVVGLTAAATVVTLAILALVSPILGLACLLTPLGARALVRRRLREVRDRFAEQLPANLQVLASALRAGHGLSGAFAVVVENAHEPSRRELRRAVADEQLGVSPDEALRRVASRMGSRDLEQVALLAELQRTTGGNAAEVLDTVVETIRERADLRRLVKTLTAQGRMARWILTALPVVSGLAFWLIQPEVMRPMLESTGGQIALVFAAFMVATGSFVIQRIVDIDI